MLNKILKLLNQGKTYREIAKQLGFKSTNTVWYYAKNYGGKKVYLTKIEREKLIEVINDLREYKDDSETFNITNSILKKL